VVDGGRVSKCSPQIMEIGAKRQRRGRVVLYAAVPHCGATHEHRDD
jgi:hypothetical protein